MHLYQFSTATDYSSSKPEEKNYLIGKWNNNRKKKVLIVNLID